MSSIPLLLAASISMRSSARPSFMEVQMAQGNSVRTIIDASDIAYVVTMLASPLSIAITGDSIAAGGGVGTAIHY